MLIGRLLNNPPAGFSDKLFDSVLVNLFVTGIFTIVYSFPVYRLLPARYYLIHNPKLLILCGQVIQIGLFKKLLTMTIWNKKQNKKYFFNGFRNGFNYLETTTMKSEFGHFMGFCSVTILAIVVGLKSSVLLAFMVLFVNIFFNFYPFMLQRFHRLRLAELRGRFQLN